jgi:hypothetical protein
MPEVGQICTDAEYASLPGFPSKGSDWPILVQLVIKGAEAKIIRATSLAVSANPIEREPYTVEPPVRRDNIVTHPKDIIILRRCPLSTFDKLEIVQSRDSNGEVNVASELPRQAYAVDLATGIIRLLYSVPLDPSIWPYPMSLDPNNMWPFAGSFPPGVNNILASYTAESSSIPDDLKMLALMFVARMWKKFSNQDWEVVASNLGGNSASIQATEWTPIELGYLRNHQHGIFPSFH